MFVRRFAFAFASLSLVWLAPVSGLLAVLWTSGLFAQEATAFAKIDGSGPDWKLLTGDDFVMVNGDEDTWNWEGSMVRCKGKPVGVTRSQKIYKNFELVAQWRHMSSGGNSGVFVWAPAEVLKDLPKGKLPGAGIEVQVLDHGFKEKYEAGGKVADWFTTHGDVFPVGKSSMTPFPPVSPKGARSFPRENRSLPSPQWNHYYIRAIAGEVRLWVNGGEVSGGNHCSPAEGYLCLESEGAPVEFKDLRIRELP